MNPPSRRSTFALLGSLALGVLVACDEGNAPTSQAKSPDRPISVALRNSCPEPTAARTLADTVEGVKIRLSPMGRLTGSIFDSLGMRRARIDQEILLRDSMDTRDIWVAWDGRDSMGAWCPAGRYFVFTEIRDSLGGLLAKDSSCLYRSIASGS